MAVVIIGQAEEGDGGRVREKKIKRKKVVINQWLLHTPPSQNHQSMVTRRTPISLDLSHLDMNCP